MDLQKINPDYASPKFISGIDALYYRVKINEENYNIFVNNILLSGLLANEERWEINSYDYTSRFTRFSLYSVTETEGNSPTRNSFQIAYILFRRISEKDNLEELEIRLDTFYMNSFGYKQTVKKVEDILSSYGLNFVYTKVSRLDLNSYIFGYDFSRLDDTYFATRMSSSKLVFEQNLIGSEIKRFGKKETITIGNRKGYGLFYRLYNKTRELKKHDFDVQSKKELLIDHRFKEKYPNDDFDSSMIWNSEFEIKREALKEYSIFSIDDVFTNVNSLFSELAKKRIRLLDSVKQQSNNKRLLTSKVWQQMITNYKLFDCNIVPLERSKFKKYTKGDNWILNRIDEYIAENCEKDFKSVYLEIGRRLCLL